MAVVSRLDGNRPSMRDAVIAEVTADNPIELDCRIDERRRQIGMCNKNHPDDNHRQY
ncbi:MAG: hypothetical protein K0U41_01645 [Gammaproteobacteria bacterium]|nr:hypothetical protein [Gammaproteobacteria bacterium]